MFNAILNHHYTLYLKRRHLAVYRISKMEPVG